VADAVQPCVAVLDTLLSSTAPLQSEGQQSLLANILELLACMCEGSEMAVQRLSAGAVGAAALTAAAHVSLSSTAAPVEKLAASKLLHVLAEDNTAVRQFMHSSGQEPQLLALLQAAASAAPPAAAQASLASQCHLLGFAGHIGAFSSQVGGELVDALAAVCSAVFSALQLLQGAEALQVSIEATTAAAAAHAAAVQHNRKAMDATPSGAAAGASSQDIEALQEALHGAQAETHKLRHTWSAKVQTAKLLCEVTANIAAGTSDAESSLSDEALAKLSAVSILFHAAACGVLQHLPSVFTTSGDGSAKVLPSIARERILVLISCMVSALSNLEASAGLTAGQQGSWWGALLAATQVAAQHVPETKHTLDALLTSAASSLGSCAARGAQVPLEDGQLHLLTQLLGAMQTQQAAVLPTTLPTLITVLAQISVLAGSSGSIAVLGSLVPLLLQAASAPQLPVAIAALDGLVDVFSGDEAEVNTLGKSLGVGQAMRAACAQVQQGLHPAGGAAVPDDTHDAAEEVLENVQGLLEYKQGILG